MAGYDDSRIIAEVRERLLADPTLSRRAAIIAIAGEDALRRIEMKMKRLGGDDPVALDWARRLLVAAEHAERYPVRRVLSAGDDVVAIRHPVDGFGHTESLVGFHGDAPTCMYGTGVFDHLDRGANLLLATGSLRNVTNPLAMAAGFTTFGLMSFPGMEAWPHRGGNVHRVLATALSEAWRERGLGASLDDAVLLDEACRLESERLAEGGLDAVLDRFPQGFAAAMDLFVYGMPEGKTFGFRQAGLAEWLTGDAARPALVCGLGALARLVEPFRSATGLEPGIDPEEATYRLLRKSHYGRPDGLTPEAAAWLHRTFARSGGALLSHATCYGLVAHRAEIGAMGELSREDLHALTALMERGRAAGLDARDVVSAILTVVRSGGTVHGLAAALSEGPDGDEAEAQRVGEFCRDLEGLRFSLWSHLVARTAASWDAARSGAAARRSWRFDDEEVEEEAAFGSPLASLVGETLGRDRDAAGVVAFVREWMRAGRPGLVACRGPESTGFRSHAFWLNALPNHAPDPSGWLALTDFLSAQGGGPDAAGNVDRAIGDLIEAALPPPAPVARPASGMGRWIRRATDLGASLIRARAA